MDTTGALGFTLHPPSSLRRIAIPVTVAVGHRSSVVAAGLAATLAQTPGCDVRLSTISPDACAGDCGHDAQLIFGDKALLNHLRECTDLPMAGALGESKFIWITLGDEEGARAAKAAGQIDEHVPLECAESDLFAMVRRLIGLGDGVGSPQGARPRHRFHGGLAPGALRRVRDYIDEHLTERLRAESLARIAGLSLGHFSRAFKQTTGVSPHRYVMQKRIAMATGLLCSTARALAQIALDVGFADQSHFSRVYLAVTGETPGACRRRHR